MAAVLPQRGWIHLLYRQPAIPTLFSCYDGMHSSCTHASSSSSFMTCTACLPKCRHETDLLASLMQPQGWAGARLLCLERHTNTVLAKLHNDLHLFLLASCQLGLQILQCHRGRSSLHRLLLIRRGCPPRHVYDLHQRLTSHDSILAIPIPKCAKGWAAQSGWMHNQEATSSTIILPSGCSPSIYGGEGNFDQCETT